MLSTGGIATPETAMRFPVRLLESGPAAGALAAAHLRRRRRRRRTCSRSTWAARPPSSCVIDDGEPLTAQRVRGRPPATASRRARACRSRSPVIEMIEIGAGGGSIARVDSLGLLKVGPGLGGRRSRARSATGAAAPSRPSPTPTWCSATSTRPSSSAAAWRSTWSGARRAIADRVAAPLGLSRRGGRLGHPPDRQREHGRTPRACTRWSAGRTRAACRCSRSAAPGRCTASGVARGARLADADRAVRRRRDCRRSASWPRRWRSTSCARGRRRSTRSTGSAPNALLAEMEREGVDAAGRVRRGARPRSRTRARGRHALRRAGPRDPRRRGPADAATPPPSRGRVRGGVPSGSTAGSDPTASRWRRSPGACSRPARGRPSRLAVDAARRGDALKGERQAWHPRARRPHRDARSTTATGSRPAPASTGPAIVEERESTARHRPRRHAASSTSAGTSW